MPSRNDLEQYLCSGENNVEMIAKKDIAFPPGTGLCHR